VHKLFTSELVILQSFVISYASIVFQSTVAVVIMLFVIVAVNSETGRIFGCGNLKRCNQY